MRFSSNLISPLASGIICASKYTSSGNVTKEVNIEPSDRVLLCGAGMMLSVNETDTNKVKICFFMIIPNFIALPVAY
jgi:hypothetical protein